MKIWLLEAIDGSEYFDPWYDKMFGIVVVAESEEKARLLAAEAKADEGKQPWLSPEHTSCEEILTDVECVVIQDCRWA
jgi:hypothetical protein